MPCNNNNNNNTYKMWNFNELWFSSFEGIRPNSYTILCMMLIGMTWAFNNVLWVMAPPSIGR
jgi:hypothetical protein